MGRSEAREEERGRDAARLPPKLAYRNRDRDGGVTVAPSGDREAQTQCGHNSAIRLLFPSLSARKKTIISLNNCPSVFLIHRQLVDRRPLVQGGQGRRKEAHGCRRLGGDAARPTERFFFEQVD